MAACGVKIKLRIRIMEIRAVKIMYCRAKGVIAVSLFFCPETREASLFLIVLVPPTTTNKPQNLSLRMKADI